MSASDGAGQVPLRPDQIRQPAHLVPISQPLKRLYWTLRGPLNSSIDVLGEDLNPDGPREPYSRQTPAGTTWHPISREPATQQPVASLTVTEMNLDGWQDAWIEFMQRGDDFLPDDHPDEPPTFEPLEVTASNGEFVTVHDYVSALHPWLMLRRELILRAIYITDEDYPQEPDTRLMTQVSGPELVWVEHETQVLDNLRRAFEVRRSREQTVTTG